MPTKRSKVIQVSNADLNVAIPGNPSRCAIAVAVKRQFPEATYINVGRGTIAYTIKSEGLRYTHRTSLKAADAQEKLDKGQGVTAADFPPIRLYFDEAVTKPITFTEKERQSQNKRRAELREGKRVVKPMTEKEKAKRRSGRRHA